VLQAGTVSTNSGKRKATTKCRGFCEELLMEKIFGGNAWSSMHVAGRSAWPGLCVLLCYFPAPALAQSPQPSVVQGRQRGVPDARATGTSAGLAIQQSLGSVSGIVVDPSEAIVAGAQVRLTREDQSPSKEVLSQMTTGASLLATSPPGPSN
jgi:hypothetical protein